MSEWQKVILGDVIKLIGGGTPKTTITEYWGGTIPWLSVKDFNGDNKYVYNSEKYITELGLNNSSTKLLKKGDVIISARGTVGELAMIPYPMAFNQSCYGVRPKDNNINNNYLYYLLSCKIAEIKSKTHGSVFDTITRETFDNIEVKLPSLEEQERITAILGSLDDKIELNNRMNANLEEQAQALFKRWFMDFEFPNEEGKPYRSSGGEMFESEMGLIPKGWKVGTLGEIASFISRGITPKYCDTSSEIVLNQKCIRDHKIIFSNARNHTPKQKNDKWLEYGDVLINSTGQGTLGRVSQYLFNTNNVTVDSHITIVRSLNRNLSYFLGYNLLGREKEIEFLASGSTGQTELSRVSVQQMDIVYPNTETIETFNRVIKPISGLMITNQQESQTLAQLRDSLLPKLMSGELKV